MNLRYTSKKAQFVSTIMTNRLCSLGKSIHVVGMLRKRKCNMKGKAKEGLQSYLTN